MIEQMSLEEQVDFMAEPEDSEAFEVRSAGRD